MTLISGQFLICHSDLSSNFIQKPTIKVDSTQIISRHHRYDPGILSNRYPPVQQNGIALSRRIDFPVQLRLQYVNPALLQPQYRIAVDFGELIETLNGQRQYALVELIEDC